MLGTKQTFTVISFLITIFSLPIKADYRVGSKAIRASGGEDHTLVLTGDNGAWACGPNGGYEQDVEYYWGVLGTGNTDYQYDQKTLVRVGMDLNHLEDICEIDAGWKHSLALDANDMVWSWGWNSEGQSGNGKSGNFLKDFA